MGDLVSLLLILFGVDQEGTRSHRGHVAVLSTDVDIGALVIKHVRVAVDLELVRVEMPATLNQDGQRVLKEV